MKIIDEKNPSLENKEDTANIVGLGAVIFGALYNNKIKDIIFSYEKALNFDGETSVYVQYTCARAASVLAKAKEGGIAYMDAAICTPNAQEFELLKALREFPDIIISAAKNNEPSLIARFAVDTAQKFNKFYIECKIMQAETEERRAFRLRLTDAALVTLSNALTLLGIGIPEKM